MSDKKYKFRPYEKIFPELFRQEKKHLISVLGNDVVIEHFGSSSIPGLGGKGIIDIYVSTKKDNIKKVWKDLEKKLGYEFGPAGGNERRFFFKKHKVDRNNIKRTYHLHLTDYKNPNFKQSIAFRDYMIAFPKAAERYKRVKMHASELALRSDDYETQKNIYKQTKNKFIEELNKKAVLWYENNVKK